MAAKGGDNRLVRFVFESKEWRKGNRKCMLASQKSPIPIRTPKKTGYPIRTAKIPQEDRFPPPPGQDNAPKRSGMT